jgi:arylsulfatase A-like enzyme
VSRNAIQKPNLVFLITDDQGYGELGCHGNPYIRTPNLDRLHAESVRFTNFHVGPTCSPTRSGLLTGHYANSTGVWHTVGGRSLLRKDERTLAEFMADAGYATGMFGKWHLGDNAPYRPQDRGFSEVVTFGGGAIGNTPDFWENHYYNDHYCRNGQWEPFTGYCTDIWFREASEFIERNRNEPFFCYIPVNAPHKPYIVDPMYSEPYKQLAASDPEAAAFFNYPATESIINFYGMVSCIDDNLGKLCKQLAELGIDRNTLFVFMSDNGSGGGVKMDKRRFASAGYNAGMRGIKGSPYEGGHRVPFFLHYPAGGIDQGQDVAELTANVDFLPTMLDLCGIDAADEYEFHGKSLAPLICDPQAEWAERAVVTDSQRIMYPIKWRMSCVMRKQWRLINGQELYDLSRDPGQREDVSGQYPDVVRQLRADYEVWWELVSAKFDEKIPISIGLESVGTVLLNSHDWRAVPDLSIPNDDPRTDSTAAHDQVQIREGVEKNGYWEIQVERSGTYRFELRRWPKEQDLGIGEGLPGPIKPYTEALADGYSGGRSIQVEKAGISVGGVDRYKPIRLTDRSVCFDIELPKGYAELNTTFHNGQGLSMGAYYVYVDWLENGNVVNEGEQKR